MSRRIIIVVEGDTEEEFVKSSLQPHFQGFGIHDVRGIKIQTSPGHKGGIGNYGKFKRNVENYLKQEKDIVVSSLLDFFRLPTSFPKYEEALKIPYANERVSFLENAIGEDINHHRFIPYLQLHEFEALLFTHSKGFEYCGFSDQQRQAVQSIMDSFENPEEINNHPDTAPSKRLQKIVPGYNKVLHGNIIIQENGFHSLLEKCPRFSTWIKRLITQATGQ